MYQLSDYRGKQAVVLAWFPKANTHGCTIECRSLAENGDQIRQFDVKYFMASVDPLGVARRH
ncbi:redoxin domain-containing protein [Castellaniella sp.]|uniref:redoxin domain-containing protein n=1 Tax=Castellaniella sp. TaxID=1955812 RepID=UPI003A8D1367